MLSVALFSIVILNIALTEGVSVVHANEVASVAKFGYAVVDMGATILGIKVIGDNCFE